MTKILTDATKLDEQLTFPDGYNRVIVEGRGDEYKRQRFPIIDIQVPREMVSDGETWYLVSAFIRDTNDDANVLVQNRTETVTASEFEALNARFYIKTLNGVYVDDNGSPGAEITQYVTEFNGNTIYFSRRLDDMPENPQRWTDFYLDYDGNVAAKFGTGYPADLPPHKQPPEEEQEDNVGGDWDPDHAGVLVDGRSEPWIDPPTGVASVSILFQPTKGGSGDCVLNVTYRGFSDYKIVPVLDGTVDEEGRPNLNLEADPSSVVPYGQEVEGESTAESLLTCWGTKEDGTPLEDGTQIKFELLSGLGSFRPSDTQEVETIQNIVEEITTSDPTTFRVRHPIVRINSTELFGVTNGNYAWTFDAAGATIENNTVTLAAGNELPLAALPLIIDYDGGGAAKCTYRSSKDSLPDEEYLLSGKIVNTRRNATTTISIKGESDKDKTNDRLSISADPTTLDAYNSGVPENPPTVVYTSTLEVTYWDSDGYVPSDPVQLRIIYGGKSGRLGKSSLSCRDTKEIVDERVSITRDDNNEWKIIELDYPIRGAEIKKNSGGAGTGVGKISGGSGIGGGAIDLGYSVNVDIRTVDGSTLRSAYAYGNTIVLRDAQDGGLPVDVSYTATGFGTTTYKATKEGVEEKVGIAATSKANAALYDDVEIQVGDPANDNYNLLHAYFNPSSVEFQEANPLFVEAVDSPDQEQTVYSQIVLVVEDADTESPPPPGTKVTINVDNGSIALSPSSSGYGSSTVNGFTTASGQVAYAGSSVFYSVVPYREGKDPPLPDKVVCTATLYGTVDSVADQPIETKQFSYSIKVLPPEDASETEVTLFEYELYCDPYNDIIKIGSIWPEDQVSITLADRGALAAPVGDDEKAKLVRYGNTVYVGQHPLTLRAMDVSCTFYNQQLLHRIVGDMYIDSKGSHAYKKDDGTVLAETSVVSASVTDPIGELPFGVVNIAHRFEGDSVDHLYPVTVAMEETTSFVADPESPPDTAGEGEDSEVEYPGVPYAYVYVLDPNASERGTHPVPWRGQADVSGKIKFPIKSTEYPNGIVGPLDQFEDPVEYEVFLSAANFRYNRDPVEVMAQYYPYIQTAMLDQNDVLDYSRGYDKYSSNNSFELPYTAPDYEYKLSRTFKQKIAVKAKIWHMPDEKIKHEPSEEDSRTAAPDATEDEGILEEA